MVHKFFSKYLKLFHNKSETLYILDVVYVLFFVQFSLWVKFCNLHFENQWEIYLWTTEKKTWTETVSFWILRFIISFAIILATSYIDPRINKWCQTNTMGLMNNRKSNVLLASYCLEVHGKTSHIEHIFCGQPNLSFFIYQTIVILWFRYDSRQLISWLIYDLKDVWLWTTIYNNNEFFIFLPFGFFENVINEFQRFKCIKGFFIQL